MCEDEIDLRPDVDETDLDRAVSASTLALSAIPAIGPLVAEAVKHAIPNQRIDRIAHMLKILDRQVGSLQRDFLEQRMQTEEFHDLLEDAVWQTTRALTDERREYIASLLKNSLTSDELLHEEEKTLLSLLGQLNDSELIILGGYAIGWVGPENKQYRTRHHEVLMNPHMETGMSPESMRNAILKQTYRTHLRDLGLAVSGKGRNDEITPLGRLLLQQIDFYSIQGLNPPS